MLAGAVSLLVAVTTVLVAAPASAATVHEITARWADGTATEVATGQVVQSEWRVNVNDDAAAPGNAPVDNVNFSVTVGNGLLKTIPDVCLTSGVTPASSISADGRTLVCNLGTKDQGSAHVVQIPVEADGETGDQITMSGSIADQTADLSPITIRNPFAMDMAWQSPTNFIGWGDAYVDVDVQWTLFLQRGSDAGPNQVTYLLDVTNTVGAAVSVGPNQCSPFTSGGASGHPWSGGSHPADQLAPFATNCTITPTGTPGQFQLTITGIDYSQAAVPTRDSLGQALPADRAAVASGSIWLRFASAANNSMTLTASAPTYTSASGATSVDDTSNNTSNKTWTRGGWANAWQPEATGVTVPSWWSGEFRVSPGSEVQSVTSWTWKPTNPATINGQCMVLDTRFVDFLWAELRLNWGGGPVPGADVEYYVGTHATVDPANSGYNPNDFRCADDPAGWTSTLPADLSTVKAVRATYPASAWATADLTTLNIRQRIKDTTPIGQDVWEWGAALAEDGTWTHPNRSMDPADRTGPLTPGDRYPFIGSGRDMVEIIGAVPDVVKSVDRTSVRPGIPANYTLTYTANGTGQIPPTVDDFTLVDTLPVGMTYVAGSATPEPQVTTDPQGRQVLTWSLDAVPTNRANVLKYQAVPGQDVAPGTVLTNFVTAGLNGEQSNPSYATVVASTNGSTLLAKTTDQWFIANPDGSGDGEGSWTVTLRSEDPLPQEFTDTIDILPYNGDQRGTSYSGTFEVTNVDVPAGATVYYTDEDPATLSDDPRDASNGAPGSIAGNTVGWSTTKPANPTAIRVIGGELAPGATTSFTIDIATDGARPGDVWMNRAQAVAEHTELVMRTSEPLTMGTMYSVSLKKYVQNNDGEWVDANDAAEYPSYRPGDTVNYRVVVTNTGQGTLTDLVVSDDKQPELGSFTIDELLPGEENAYVHEYEIVLEESAADSVVNTACVNVTEQPADAEDPVQVSCDPAGITVDGDPEHTKELLSATPIGGGQWELVYGIDVTNTSAHPTSYSLTDTLHFTDQASIASATVTASPTGVTLADPAWDGQQSTLIAASVPLLGNDDTGYAAHHYEVTVVADVPLHIPGAGSDPDPTACPAEGSDADQGFNNVSGMTDAKGELEEDQACAEIPSIEIAKSIVGDPVKGANGQWTVTYEITAKNTGSAAGEYTLTDRLRFGAGLTVDSAEVTEAPAGVTLAEGWTGQGEAGAAENVVATGTLDPDAVHAYRVVVKATLDTKKADASTVTCPAAGSDERGGFANTAGVDHNGLSASANACDVPEWPKDVPPPLAITGGQLSAGVIGAALLLLIAGGVLLTIRRRRATAETPTE